MAKREKFPNLNEGPNPFAVSDPGKVVKWTPGDEEPGNIVEYTTGVKMNPRLRTLRVGNETFIILDRYDGQYPDMENILVFKEQVDIPEWDIEHGPVRPPHVEFEIGKVPF